MGEETVITSMGNARRLFVTKQHLSGSNLTGSFEKKAVNLIKELGYVQWDPITVVAPSHLISLWSRIGNFDWSELEKLMWNSRLAFLHWTPVAILALTEDYPIFNSLMKDYPESLRGSWGSHVDKARDFLETHTKLRQQVLAKLSDGPAEIRQFRDYGKRQKSEDGWSSGNEVTTLLYHLHMLGAVMVSGHIGNQNQWCLTDEFLPDWTDRKELSVEELDRRMVVRSLRAMGIASAYDINRYFVRGRYRKLKDTIKSLKEESEILPLKIDGSKKNDMFIHSEDLKTLDKLERGKWHPELKLISPFDNLISIRERTKRMFGFDYILEQFVPKEKRKYGTYVLPILWGDRLAGRIDVKLEKDRGVLRVNSVHSEAGFGLDTEIPAKLVEVLQNFSSFLNAEKISYGKVNPPAWRKFLT